MPTAASSERPTTEEQKAADRRGAQPSRVESRRARDSAPLEAGGPVRSRPSAARPRTRTGAIWRGCTMISSERLGKYAAAGIDFSVYISDNVLSHILVTLNTEFHVSRCPAPTFPLHDWLPETRHVLCKVGNGFRCICVQYPVGGYTCRDDSESWPLSVHCF